MIRWTRRPLATIAVVLGFVVGSPGVASALTDHTAAYTYISNEDCAWNGSWITNEWGHPGLQTVGTMDWWGNGVACGNQTVAAPLTLAVQQNLAFWNGFQWLICRTNPPWVYNTTWSHDVWTSYAWASPPCPNPGFYRSVSNTATWNGAWHSAGAIWGNGAVAEPS